MKKNCIYVFLVLLAMLGFVTPARGQAMEELEFSVSRDFGSSDGTGNIRGTFSMKVTGPSNLVKVQFYIDNTMIAEDTEPPFKVQFVTDEYAPGKHTMHATGYTSDGRELRTRAMTFNYMTAEESWQRGLNIILPILVLVLIWKLFSTVVPTLSSGRKKGELLPPGGHNYGVIGGTICPRCAHPFARNLFSPNLLVGKLVCCPNCGKWFIGRRASWTCPGMVDRIKGRIVVQTRPGYGSPTRNASVDDCTKPPDSQRCWCVPVRAWRTGRWRIRF